MRKCGVCFVDHPKGQEVSLPQGWVENYTKRDSHGFNQTVCVSCIRTASEKPRAFRAPFTGTAAKNETARCSSCGRCGYTHYFVVDIGLIPQDWTVRTHDGALFCQQCSHGPDSFMTTYADRVTVFRDSDGAISVREPPVPPAYVPYLADEPEPIPVTETKGKTMNEKMKDQMSELGGALAEGGKLAVIDEGGEIFIDIVREVAKDSPLLQMALETDDGKAVAKLLAAVCLHSVASYSTILPKPHLIKRVAQAQITVSSLKLLQPRLKRLRKHFEKLVGLGEQLAEFDALPEGDTNPLDFSIGEKKRATATAR